ncbi:MAG: YecA family protein [bacterium]
MNKKTSKPLSDDEQDELDEFLLSDTTPISCMDLIVLDGFLTGIALTPDIISQDEWIKWVWDMDEGKEIPDFNNYDKPDKVVDYIFRHYNYIVKLLRNGDFEPIYISINDDYYGSTSWCEGFMVCVTKFKDQWKTILKDKPDLFEPIVLLGTEKGQEILDDSGNGDDINYIDEINDRVCEVVPELYKHIKNKGGSNVYQMIH